MNKGVEWCQRRVIAIVVMLFSGILVGACASSALIEEKEASQLLIQDERFSRVVDADSSIAAWLNTESDLEPDPPSSWSSFEYNGGDVTFTITQCGTVDFLDLIAYPGGIDKTGMPVSAEHFHVCGGQEGESCDGDRGGETAQTVSAEVLDQVASLSDYFAVTAICLPSGGSGSTSCIYFLRHL